MSSKNKGIWHAKVWRNRRISFVSRGLLLTICSGQTNCILLVKSFVVLVLMIVVFYEIFSRQTAVGPVVADIPVIRSPVSYATPRRSPRPTPQDRIRLWQQLLRTPFVIGHTLEPEVTTAYCPYWADNVGMPGLSVYTTFIDFDEAHTFACFHRSCSFNVSFGNTIWLSEEDWEVERDRALEQMIEHLRQHARHYPFACSNPLPLVATPWWVDLKPSFVRYWLTCQFNNSNSTRRFVSLYAAQICNHH